MLRKHTPNEVMNLNQYIYASFLNFLYVENQP
jgi:hypothetical protein